MLFTGIISSYIGYRARIRHACARANAASAAAKEEKEEKRAGLHPDRIMIYLNYRFN